MNKRDLIKKLKDIDHYKRVFGLAEGLKEGFQKTTQKTTQKILVEIQRNPEVSRTELAVLVGLTPEGVKYHLNKMKNRTVPFFMDILKKVKELV